MNKIIYNKKKLCIIKQKSNNKSYIKYNMKF